MVGAIRVKTVFSKKTDATDRYMYMVICPAVWVMPYLCGTSNFKFKFGSLCTTMALKIAGSPKSKQLFIMLLYPCQFCWILCMLGYVDVCSFFSKLTFCQSWSGSKLFAKVINRWLKSPLFDVISYFTFLWMIWGVMLLATLQFETMILMENKCHYTKC